MLIGKVYQTSQIHVSTVFILIQHMYIPSARVAVRYTANVRTNGSVHYAVLHKPAVKTIVL